MKRLLMGVLIFSILSFGNIDAQNSFVLDLNGLTEQQKVEAYLSQADRLDAESEILFLIYATQRASEILFFIADKEIEESSKAQLEAHLYLHWARIYHFLQEPQLALDQLHLAQTKSNQEFLRRRVQLLLLTIQQEIGEYEQALAISERLLAQDIRDLQRYNILLQQAHIYRMLERWNSAINSANNALSLAKNELASTGYEALLELGRIAWTQENFDKALEYWEEAYDAANRQANNRMMAQAYYLIAKQYMDRKMWSEGYYYAQRSLLLIAGEERTNLFADAHYLLAQYYLNTGEFDQAFISLDLVHQVALRVEHQRSITTRLALNLSLMRDNNDFAINTINQKLVLQQRIGYVQIVVIVMLILGIFILIRKTWEKQAQQKIAELAYKALTKRVSRTSGTLKVQVAKMLDQDYSFGIIVTRITNWQAIMNNKEGNVIMELAIDGLKQSLVAQVALLEEAPAMQVNALDHVVFFYFEDEKSNNFMKDLESLPKKYRFSWQKKELKLDLVYEHHFHHHEHKVAKEEILDWLNKLT